jgi:PAS domain S-box-containing protein
LERHVNAEARGEALSGVSPVGLFRTDAAGRCLAVNARWCEITGLASVEALGEGWARALHRDDRERVLEGWRQATNDARGFEAEFRFRRPDGIVTSVLAQALPERDAHGRISGFVGAITDLSRHLAVQQELIEERKQAVSEIERHSEQLRRLALQLALAQEHERRRIAAGLHDEVGQILAVARAKLGQLIETGGGGGRPVPGR